MVSNIVHQIALLSSYNSEYKGDWAQDSLDMRFHFTSGYHPEANGQAKQTNQTLEQYCKRTSRVVLSKF